MRLWGCRVDRWALLALLWTAPALAGAVLVVRSSDGALYKQVETAFSAAIGQTTQSVSASKDQLKDVVNAQMATSPSLVFALGADAAKVLSEVKPGVPVLYALVPNPARAGIEGRLPGVPMFVPPAQQMKIVKQVLPSAKRIGILFDPSLSLDLLESFEEASKSSGMSVVRAEVKSRQEVAGSARDLVGRKVDVLWIIPDSTVVGADSFKFLVQLSLESKVPLVGFSEEMGKAGALVAVEAAPEEIGKKAANMAKQLMSNAPAGSGAPDGSIYVNAKVAQVLGIDMPASVRGQATRVFE